MKEMVLRSVGDYDLVCESSMKCFVPGDVTRMKALIELSFGRKLVDGYMDNGDFQGVIVEAGLKSIALVRGIEGIPYSYLCKFATDPEKRGNGVGLAVWSLLKMEYPELMWRTGNGPERDATNRWYVSHGAEGPIPVGGYNVYWLGIREENAARYAPLVAAIPCSFAESK
jgi:acetylglutamate synthase